MSKSPTPSVVPAIEEMTPEERDYTERALLAMANEIVVLNEATERVVTMFRELALQYRVPV